MKTLIVAALLLIASTAQADFTIDSRSGLHLGYSALFGAGVNTIAYHGIRQWNRPTRLLASTILGAVPGTIKEVMIDDYIDYGDLLMNPVGAFLGGYTSEKINKKFFGKSKHDLYVIVTDKSIMIAGTW